LVASKWLQGLDLADDELRTSQQAWLDNHVHPVVNALDERTSNLTRVHRSHNEPVQVLRYNEGKYYHGHMDWSELELYPDQTEQWLRTHFGHNDRMATVFWYLNDVNDGGHTMFPKHGQPICPKYEQRNCKGAFDPDMTSCNGGLKVVPKEGAVILWYNYHPSGRGDRNALHAGCPPGKGLTKWSGNKWVNTKPFTWSEPPWIYNHPAIKRMKFAGELPTHCICEFRNAAEVVINIIYLDRHGDEEVVAPLAPGGKLTMSIDPPRKVKLRRRRPTTEAGQWQESKTVKVPCKTNDPVVLGLTKDFKFGRKKSRKSEEL